MKNVVTNVVIYINSANTAAAAAAVGFAEKIKSPSLNIVSGDDISSLPLDKNTSLVVVFGGDGTVLGAVSRTAPLRIPMLSINFGAVGFLAGAEPDSAVSVFYSFLRGECSFDDRALLDVSLDGKSHIALNDFVLRCGANTRPVPVEVLLNGSVLYKYTADGIIAATPTGSTAYSLSAGGPVLSPDVPAFVVCPICAHALSSRPVVVSQDSVLEIRAAVSARPVQFAVDGRPVGGLSGATAVIKKSEYVQRFVVSEGRGFYEKLLRKLKTGKD
ncbi:MAG: NAD(+)/NADH kinase [Clostridiales bacterium]|jgi:NAD+ kinase|nr:NAD(+)/NADH kinase [Clostridiales bacterium]